MEQYKLPSHINPDKVFIVNRSELEGRIEPLFYQPSCKIPNNIKVKFTTLSRCTKTIVHPPEYPREFSDSGFQLIRSQNVRPLGLSLDENPVYFSADFLSNKKNILAQKGDLLVVRSGVNAGDTAVVEEDYSDIIVGADTLLCKAIPTTNPKFIQVYFYTDLGKTQIIKHTTGATNKHLNSENLAKVLIPVVDANIQADCVKLFEDSLKLKQQKEAEAKALLDDIDSYLLGELGISLPEKDNSLQKRVFTTRFSEVTGGLLAPKVYDFNTVALKKAIVDIPKDRFTVKPLKEFITFSVAGDWGIEDYEDYDSNLYERCLVVRATEYDNDYNLNLDNSRVKFRLIKKDKLQRIDIQENDLLIEKSGGSPDQPVGRIAILTKDIISEQNVCYSNFLHKIRVNKSVNPSYLFSYLKTIHNVKLTESMQSQTNGIRNLIMSTYLNQFIVLPIKKGKVDIEKQNDIAQHIQSIREQAKQLQNDAKAILEQAKQEVELMILG